MHIEDIATGPKYPKSANWSQRSIKVDGVETGTVTASLGKFLEAMAELKPTNQEDWKAFYWMFGGEKPSEIEKVVVHIDKPNQRAYMWGVTKDGVQPEQESSRTIQSSA